MVDEANVSVRRDFPAQESIAILAAQAVVLFWCQAMKWLVGVTNCRPCLAQPQQWRSMELHFHDMIAAVVQQGNGFSCQILSVEG
jgi:hypothetical protein